MDGGKWEIRGADADLRARVREAAMAQHMSISVWVRGALESALRPSAGPKSSPAFDKTSVVTARLNKIEATLATRSLTAAARVQLDRIEASLASLARGELPVSPDAHDPTRSLGDGRKSLTDDVSKVSAVIDRLEVVDRRLEELAKQLMKTPNQVDRRLGMPKSR